MAFEFLKFQNKNVGEETKNLRVNFEAFPTVQQVLFFADSFSAGQAASKFGRKKRSNFCPVLSKFRVFRKNLISGGL